MQDYDNHIVNHNKMLSEKVDRMMDQAKELKWLEDQKL